MTDRLKLTDEPSSLEANAQSEFPQQLGAELANQILAQSHGQIPPEFLGKDKPVLLDRELWTISNVDHQKGVITFEAPGRLSRHVGFNVAAGWIKHNKLRAA